jgi:FtsH-binding integral membrane protein
MLAAETANRPIPGAVATAGLNERVLFLRKTYLHLAGAILAFVGIESMLVRQDGALFQSVTVPFMNALAQSHYGWLMVLGLFMAAGWVSERWAMSDTSRGVQYLGLGLCVAAWAVVFIPILTIANLYYPGVIPLAGIMTLAIFAGLTATVFITRKDFSFLRGALTVASFGALGLIVCSILFGFSLGAVFSAGMIALAAGYILYYTSRVLGYFGPTQYVAAALTLFGSVALLFWYVLRLLMSLRR